MGEVFGFGKVKSLNFFCKEALQKGNTCELWSSIICLEVRKCNRFEDFISTVSIDGEERKILKGSFIERCSKIVSAITDEGKRYEEINKTFLNNYCIPEGSNSVELKTLRILCQKDRYELIQDQLQAITSRISKQQQPKPTSQPPKKQTGILAGLAGCKVSETNSSPTINPISNIRNIPNRKAHGNQTPNI